VTVDYLDLADYIAIRSEVTGLDIETVMTSGDQPRAAALAPKRGVGEVEDDAGTMSR
jgi:hypothetical protein